MRSEQWGTPSDCRHEQDLTDATLEQTMAELTDKQNRFVDEYPINLNATQAAMRAGYSEKTAAQQGARLLKNVKIAALIAKALEARSERTKITADRVLEELGHIGFFDIRKMFDAKGDLLSPADLDDVTAAAIGSIDVVAKSVTVGEAKEIEYVHKIKACDKVRALESIGKHLGMFPTRHEHGGLDGKPIEVHAFLDVSKLSTGALEEIMNATSDAEGTKSS